MRSCDFFLKEKGVSIYGLKEALSSLKTNKSEGYNDTNFYIVMRCFGYLPVLL